MEKKSQVKFRLFEKNGLIRIAIQTVTEQEDKNSRLNASAEYYIASDPRNVSKILDTLVSTVKNVSVNGDNLCTNYRKHDTFIIEDYKRLKNHPELKPFFNKMGGKIKQQETKNKKSSGKRKNIRVGRRVFIAASLFVGLMAAVFFKSDMNAQEPVSDTLVADNTDENSEDATQEILEKYQASIIETQESMSKTVESEIIKIVEGSQTVEKFADSIPEFTKERNQDSQKEAEDKEKEKEKENENEKEPTDEVTLAEIDKQVEKIAADLVAQNKTSKEDIAEAATLALQDGQVSVELAQVQTEPVAQVEATPVEAIQSEITLVMNTDGSGINYIATYHLTPAQIDTMKATVEHEGGNRGPEEAYAIMSTVINRCESGAWPGGNNPYGVITGSGQFQSYYQGHYKKYANGKYSETTSQIVNQMLSGELLPFHDLERFSSGENATGIQFTKGGNYFR